MSNKVYPAVKAIIQQGEKFLVIKQVLPDRTVWDFPGGRVEHGESPYTTLIREVKEETHISVVIVKPAGMFWFFRTDGDQVVCTAFICASSDYSVDLTQNPADEDITEYKWVTKEEFLSNDYIVSHSSMKDIVSSL